MFRTLLLLSLCFGCAAPVAPRCLAQDAAADTRLTRRITLTEPEIPLSKLLDRLTAATGARHTFAPEARRQNLAIFCQHAPLGDIHRALQDLLAWSWTTTGDGDKSEYRFSRGVDYSQAEAKELARAQREFQQSVALMLKAAQMSPEELNQMGPQYQGVAQHVSDPQHGPFLRAWAALPPDGLHGALAGRPFSAPFAQLPAAAQAGLRDSLRGIDARNTTSPTDYGNRAIQSVTFGTDSQWGGGPESLEARFQFADGRDLITWGGFLAASQGTREPSVEERREETRPMAKADPRLDQVLTPPEKPRPHRPGDPDTGVGVKLGDLQERTSFLLLADVYPADRNWRFGSTATPPIDGVPAWEAMDRIGHSFGYHWRPDHHWYLFRFDKWVWAAQRAFAGPRPGQPPSGTPAPGGTPAIGH